MTGSPAVATVTDAVTIASALAHAGRALSARQLAAALQWPAVRVNRALRPPSTIRRSPARSPCAATAAAG